MQRPMLMVTVVYGAGIVLADRLSCPPLPLLLAGAGLAGLALCSGRLRPWLFGLLLLLAGAANLVRQKAIISPHDLRILIGEEPRIAWIRGVLRETPYHRVRVREEHERWHSLADIEVEAIRVSGQDWQPAHGRLLASTPGVLPVRFFGGDRVELDGVVRRPTPPLAQGVFDYGAFLARQGVYYQFQVASTNDWAFARGGATPAPPLADRFTTWAMATLSRGLPAVDEPLRLLWTMSLGWKTGLNGDVAEPFMRSGTMHVFAISGLHIALIASLLVVALRVFRTPRWVCGLIVIPLIWGYTAVTGWQASAVRSTVMASVILAGWSLRRPSDLLNSLAAAAFIILLDDPQQLFQASFQLSFSVVLSLALLTPVLEKVRSRWLAPDPMLPAELRPRWHAWVQVPADHLGKSLVVSLAAWIGSLPLIAYYFHLVTPASLPANLVVVPLSSAALACNLGSLATGDWLPGATVLLNHAAWFFMVLMIQASTWAARIPAGAIGVTAPSLTACALYYGVLAALLAGGGWRRRTRVCVLSGLALLGAACLAGWYRERAAAQITILPLDGGEAAYVRPARAGDDLLIDCGNSAAAEFVIKPFLRAQGVNQLDTLLLTHGDVHNTGGAQLVRDWFAPHRICFSPVPFRSSAYREQVQAFSRIPHLTRTVRDGDRVGPWTVLHPASTDHFAQADDNVIVLQGQIGECRVLLLSDLGRPGQHALLSRHRDLRADVVVSGLPARTEPLADALLDVVQPRLIVITDSDYPAPQRASAKLRERLAGREVPVLYTRETGAVTLTFRPGRCEVTSMNGVRLGWETAKATTR